MTIKLGSKKESTEVAQNADIAKKKTSERKPNRNSELEPTKKKNANAKAAMAQELEGMGLSPAAIERILCIDVAAEGPRLKA